MTKGESECKICFEKNNTLIFCKIYNFPICNECKNKMKKTSKCPQCQNINE